MRARPAPTARAHTDSPASDASVEGADSEPRPGLSDTLTHVRARNARILRRARRSQALDAPEIAALPLAIIPQQDRDVTPLPEDVRSIFLTRLAWRIDRVFASPADTQRSDATDHTTPEPCSAIVASSCGVCRGACCTRGGDHAFLGEDSLARVRASHASHSAASLLSEYRTHLPSAHYSQSCVYHAIGGCALPRRLRSTTCNRYLCGALTQLSRALAATRGTAAVVGAANDTQLRALVLIDGSGMRTLAVAVDDFAGVAGA